MKRKLWIWIKQGLSLLWIWIKQSLFLLIGSAFCAFSVKAVLIPQGFFSTGLTGAALVLYYRYPVAPIEVLYLMINIPIFLLGWAFVGVRFVLYSLWGMLLYSLMLHIINVEINISDPILSVITAGGFSGIGVAIFLGSFGFTGGAEIFSGIIHKLFSFSVGTGTAIINGIVLTACTVLFPIEMVLYAVVYAVVNMLTIDKVFYGPTQRKAALIISEKWFEIINDLIGKCNIGVTTIKSNGAYQGTGKTILYSVFSRKDVNAVKKVVLQNDPGAFMALMTAEDVTGLRIGNQPHW